ncbi:MAG: hypothetical protein HUU57_15150, partial [Bdellovibrio sp.]|nr:hypothetical protein [Bdellovibrio sp.]
VSAAPTLNGQVLRYASGSLVPSFVSMLDLRSNVTGSQALSASCGSNKTLTFNSATDSLLCENISITKSQISDLGTFGSLAAKSSVDLTADVNGVLPIANGGTGSNSVGQNLVFAGPSSGGAGAPSFRTIAAADLPASATYWSAATGGINYASGNIGIGTTTPNAALDVVGNMTASGNVGASVPAGSVVLMSSCAGGWTDVGTLAVGVPAAATCNGTSCHMCQAPAPSALIPSSSVLLMESCPKNWIYISTVSGAATAAGLNIPYSSCQSPASATSLPLGSKLIMASCPSQWSDLGQTTSGPLSANCGGSACRVCEVPGSTLAAQWQTSSGTLLLQPTSGNVGIGTSSPRAALDVNGAIVGKSAVSNASATIDFASGNMQYTTSDCGAFDLWNLKDGGTYMFAVQGTNATTCSFTAYLASGTSALTVHLPPDHGQTISGKHTIYSFAVIGSHVYVAWTPGM